MAPIQLGVLMIRFQALDAVGPLDIISSSSKALFTGPDAAGFPAYAGLSDKAIDVNYHYISTNLDPVELTAGIKLLPTTTCATCPPLDILLVGGPDPMSFTLDPVFADFVRAHVSAGKQLFTTCTGAWAIAGTGVLDGKNATTNHEFLDLAAVQYPAVKWTKEKQWVEEGNLWTAGGACAGMDMVAHWVRENYGAKISNLGLAALDFEPRDVVGRANLVVPPKKQAVA